jgi:hypothetical protein
MAQRVCDLKPCDRLREARKFLSVNPDPAAMPDGPLIVSALRPTNGPKETAPVRLNFKYCPFCGTRVSSATVDYLRH